MNCDIITPICIIIGAILGAIAGAALNAKYSISTIKKQEFIKAAAKFRSTFVDFLYELKLKIVEKESNITMFEDIKWSKTIMDELAPNYEKACIEFEPFIAENIRASFVAVYILFLAPNRGDKYNSDERHEYCSDEKPSEELKIRNIIYERLNDVLKFAETK